MQISRNAIVASAIAALALVLSAYFLSSALTSFRSRGAKTVAVTGKAERTFTSDLIVWTATITSESPTLPIAYADLKKKQESVASYLKSKQIPAEEVTFSSVDISKDTESFYDSANSRVVSTFKGYALKQTISISSKNIQAIESVSRQISELITQGIEIESGAPRYYYTKLNELKIQMLKEAAEDARSRAEVIAEGGDGDLGKLQRSSMGVFQIVGENSDEDFSWGGSFNTSSKVKTASITVSSTYSIK